MSELTTLLDPVSDPAQRSAYTFEAAPAECDDRDPLAYLLGADWLDNDFVEVIDTATLGAPGLAGYLMQSVGIDCGQVAAVQDMLAALRSPVIIVFEEAFCGRPTKMHPDPRIVFLGTYTDLPTPAEFRATPFVPAKVPVKGYGAIVAPVIIAAILALVYWGK